MNNDDVIGLMIVLAFLSGFFAVSLLVGLGWGMAYAAVSCALIAAIGIRKTRKDRRNESGKATLSGG